MESERVIRISAGLVPPEGTPAAPPALKHDYSTLIGRSAALSPVLSLVDRATDVDIPVLIQGESGTGKEVVARCLHGNGPRRAGPFVAVNCAAIPETLLESELFGHGRGAFTGAHRKRTGMFVRAHGGTLFLDEVGEMSPSMQAKLLRVVQDREVQPLGEHESRTVDVRLVCATNRNLSERVREGKFREDLYYRINVIRVDLPPLRKRLEDLPLLCAHFLKESRKTLSAQALDRLMAYPWPGNIRELSNVLERAAVMSTGPEIGQEWIDLPDGPGECAPSAESLRGFLDRSTRSYLLEVLNRCGWNRRRTALLLGIDRTTLYRLIRKFGITAA